METTDLTNLSAVLTFLAGPAGVLAWYILVSNWFRNATTMREDGTKLVNLNPTLLQLVVFLASVSLPILAFVILNTVPPETITAIAPTYQFFAMLFLGYIGQQGWFALTKASTTTKVSVSSPAATSDASGATKATGAINVSVGPSTTTPAPSGITEVTPPVNPAG